MQPERDERRKRPGRGRRGETGHSIQPGPALISSRLKELITTMQQKERQAPEGGRRVEREQKHDKDPEAGVETRSGDDGRRSERGGGEKWWSAASEGCDGGIDPESLRWRVNKLENEKLELASSHNQELCRLEAELTRLRSLVERGETQRAELQYQLTVSQRDADRAAKLTREKQELTERAEELQHTVQELQRALDITRQAREEDQRTLQQEVEECEKLIQSFGSENQQLHRLLEDHEETLEEMKRRIAEVQKEKEKEAEVNRRQADELKYLSEREERSRRDKELSDQRVKSLEMNVEAERASHLESKFNSELVQLRVRDLEAAVAAERSDHLEAQSNLELLRAKFREVERAYALEREKNDSTERALQRLQTEYGQNKCEQSVALETERKMTSDLSEQLQEERRQHTSTYSLLEQAVKSKTDTEEMFVSFVKQIEEILGGIGCGGSANDDSGSRSPAKILQLLKMKLCTFQHKLEETKKQVENLLLASERLQEENQSLQQLTSDQRRQVEDSERVSLILKEEVTRLRQENSDWSKQIRDLQTVLQKEREDRKREAERVREERERERERERDDRTTEVQKITDQYQKESKACLSFLYRLYQRLLAGCVLDQPQSILGDFSLEELWDVISQQVDQLTSDLHRANDKITHLQSVCDKKSVCVRELQDSQECALNRLETSFRRREEAWSNKHTHTVTQLQNKLQACHSQCDSLRDHVSSLDHHCSSLTSDLARLQGLLSRSRKESACFFLACALLSGALKDTCCRLQMLLEQKNLLSRQLVEREVLEEEVQRLADALEGDRDDAEVQEERGRRAVRRWRRGVCVVLAVRRWCAMTKRTALLFRLERGGGGSSVGVGVCGESSAATQKGNNPPSTGKGEGREDLCARWLHSKFLASSILSSMADLQGALARKGSSPADVMSAARSGLSRLLDNFLCQSDKATCRINEDTMNGRLTSSQPNMKTLVSSLQQHFLLFSQRLHSTEVERRSLRLEVANLKKGLRQERDDISRRVPAERFQSVCEELRQALNREEETKALIQEQTNQLHTLQLRVSSEDANTQNTLSQSAQALSEARREVSRKERSLRILGKHLSGVHKEKKQLEERLQRAEDELRDVSRRKVCLISYMKAAETSYKEVRDSLVRSRHSLSHQPLPKQPLEMAGAECIMGTPEVAAFQSLLSIISQLLHTYSSRIDWLEQEVSAHHSHVTALRSELQDACLRDNLAFVPVTFDDMETPPSAPASHSSDEPLLGLNTAACPLIRPLDPMENSRGGRT